MSTLIHKITEIQDHDPLILLGTSQNLSKIKLEFLHSGIDRKYIQTTPIKNRSRGLE